MFRYRSIIKTNIDLESIGLDADMFVELENLGVFIPEVRIGKRYVEMRQNYNGRTAFIDGYIYIEESRFKIISYSSYRD